MVAVKLAFLPKTSTCPPPLTPPHHTTAPSFSPHIPSPPPAQYRFLKPPPSDSRIIVSQNKLYWTTAVPRKRSSGNSKALGQGLPSLMLKPLPLCPRRCLWCVVLSCLVMAGGPPSIHIAWSWQWGRFHSPASLYLCNCHPQNMSRNDVISRLRLLRGWWGKSTFSFPVCHMNVKNSEFPGKSGATRQLLSTTWRNAATYQWETCTLDNDMIKKSIFICVQPPFFVIETSTIIMLCSVASIMPNSLWPHGL